MSSSRSKFLLFLALLKLEEEERKEYFWQKLDEEGRRRRDRRIPRCALVDPNESAWEKVYSSGNDGAMITVTGFDNQAFHRLLLLFSPYFNKYTPYTRRNDGATYKEVVQTKWSSGRPRLINPAACLALVLAWYRFSGAEFLLQGWFGFTGTHANVWLRFARRMLLLALWKLPEAKVRMPDDAKIAEYQIIISHRHPSLKDVYCVADGLKLRFESCYGLNEQSMYYNGWQHGHYVTNLFVFGPDGRILMCVINAPGSVHDSTLAEWGDVYDALEEVYARTGGKCVLDSAFSSTDVPHLIRSAQDVTKAKDAQELLMLTEATSLRQAAEWGMRAIQSAFPRLRCKIHYEESGERRIFLLLVCLLYNLRVEWVGLNQIRNVYVPEWSRDIDFVMSAV
jgi:hypothetical protein